MQTHFELLPDEQLKRQLRNHFSSGGKIDKGMLQEFYKSQGGDDFPNMLSFLMLEAARRFSSRSRFCKPMQA